MLHEPQTLSPAEARILGVYRAHPYRKQAPAE